MATSATALLPPPVPPYPVAPPPSKSLLPRRHSKWTVAIAASIVNALHICAVCLAPVLLLRPMATSLNASISSITLPLTTYRIIHALFLLPSGYAVDRFGAQPCIRISTALTALIIPFMALARSASDLVIIQALLACARMAGMGALLVLLAEYWRDEKGWGNAIFLSGFSFQAFATPLFLGWFVTSNGWRSAMAFMASSVVFIELPLAFYYLVSPHPIPPTLYQAPVSSPSSHSPGKKHETLIQVPLEKDPQSDPLFSLSFAMQLLCVGAFSYSYHVIEDHFVVHLVDLSIPYETATRYISSIELIASIAKLLIAPLIDRYSIALLTAASSAIPAFSVFFLFDSPYQFTTSSWKLSVFILLFSIGFGVVFTTLFAMTVEFGHAKLGMRSNIVLMAFFVTGGISSSTVGWMRTSTGSYFLPLVLCAIGWAAVAFFALIKYYTFDRRKQSPDKLTF